MGGKSFSFLNHWRERARIVATVDQRLAGAVMALLVGGEEIRDVLAMTNIGQQFDSAPDAETMSEGNHHALLEIIRRQVHVVLCCLPRGIRDGWDFGARFRAGEQVLERGCGGNAPAFHHQAFGNVQPVAQGGDDGSVIVRLAGW